MANANSNTPRVLRPGDVFAGRFTVVGELGAGGMGIVYDVRERRDGLERRLALKLMSPAQLRKDVRAAEHFQREADAMIRVQSEHVVRVEGVGVDEATKQPWLTMELLDGETLGQRVDRDGALTADVARGLARELGHALKAAHGVGVIHRDLKPGNLFLARRGDVQRSTVLKVLDFGLAGIINADQSRVQNTRVAGSLAWTAPEQGVPDARVGPEVDVWPLGLLAFWMLTGRHYWRAMNAREMADIMLLREITIDPLDASREDDLASRRAQGLGVGDRIPLGFDEWFARCVVRDPKARWRDGGEASDALDVVLERASRTSSIAPSAPAADLPRASLNHPPTREHVRDPTTPLTTPPQPPPQPPLASLSSAAAPLPVVGGGAAWIEGTVDVLSDPANPRASSARERTVVVPELASPRAPTRRDHLHRIAVVTGGVVLVLAALRIGHFVAMPARAPAPEPRCPPRMRLVSAGSVDLHEGSTTRRVSLRAFCMDTYEVTQSDYARCVPAGGGRGCAPANDGWWQGATDVDRARHREHCATWAGTDTYPVACVSWDMAQYYCQTRGARLPTEAQWERAARGDDGRPFPWGHEAPSARRMNGCGEECFREAHSSGAPGATSVLYLADDGWPYVTYVTHGSFADDRSTFGVVGLGGNVREWTADCAAPITEGSAQDRAVTCAEDTRARVVRGGAWSTVEADAAKASSRLPLLPATQMADLGFRCAADVIQ